MEKDDEIYGSPGTSLTAEFWHYDTRTARRWNLDPQPQINVSDYGVFSLNPVLNIDPLGNSATKYEDEDGKSIGSTSDGSNAIVTIGNADKEYFTQMLNTAKENGMADDPQRNESWTKTFGIRTRSGVVWQFGFSFILAVPDYVSSTQGFGVERGVAFDTDFNIAFYKTDLEPEGPSVMLSLGPVVARSTQTDGAEGRFTIRNLEGPGKATTFGLGSWGASTGEPLDGSYKTYGISALGVGMDVGGAQLKTETARMIPCTPP